MSLSCGMSGNAANPQDFYSRCLFSLLVSSCLEAANSRGAVPQGAHLRPAGPETRETRPGDSHTFLNLGIALGGMIPKLWANSLAGSLRVVHCFGIPSMEWACNAAYISRLLQPNEVLGPFAFLSTQMFALATGSNGSSAVLAAWSASIFNSSNATDGQSPAPGMDESL